VSNDFFKFNTIDSKNEDVNPFSWDFTQGVSGSLKDTNLNNMDFSFPIESNTASPSKHQPFLELNQH